MRTAEEILMSVGIGSGPLIFSWESVEQAIEQAQRELVEEAERLIDSLDTGGMGEWEDGYASACREIATKLSNLLPNKEG